MFVTSVEKAEEVNEVYVQYFGDSKSTGVMVSVKELSKNALVEIEFIAFRSIA
ncbi:hypothetical protein KFZ56_15465 [Virgibacillus sp. NKC19-3]|uniref:RidA family protein n=1 Tax=Virgibacillus saliphilus TaxID=2831674 RepID=UPI001C9AC249|nr:Rid family hydrolase [Virgibacillus sp. NKC19-3]MBY7144421.1 hypothetical protein [Virgibacillus sp. NKC19-3]